VLSAAIAHKETLHQRISDVCQTIHNCPGTRDLPACSAVLQTPAPPRAPLNIVKVKVKRNRYRPGVAQRVGRGIVLVFHDRGTRRGEWSAARPGQTLPPGKSRYPFYRRLGGPQGRSGRAENLVPPPRFDPGPSSP